MADDDATRLRLVELRSTNGFPRAVRFAPRLTLVTGFGSAERVGNWIATALVGPRPEGVDGTIEVAGRTVSLGELPATLLPPRASIVVADADLDTARRQAIEPRHRRVQQRREAAEAERAREEIARNSAAGRFASLEHRLAELEPALADTIEAAAADEQRAETMASLQQLLADVDEAAIAARQPDPAALELANDWLTLQEQRAELARLHPRLTVDDARRRVEVLEGAVEHARRPTVSDDDRERWHALQRDIRDAAADDASVSSDGETAESVDATATNTRREAAVAAERDALRSLGHDHTSFLVGVVAPQLRDRDIRQKEAALAAAREELRQAERVAALPTWPELAQTQFDMRARAAAILGRFPGDDVASELRAFRPGAPALAEARAKLEAALTAAGIHGEGDVETVAGNWLEEQQRHPPIDHGPRLAELSAERDTVEKDLRAQAAELVAIAARLRDLDRRLADLALQESRLAVELATDLSRCAADDVERALHDVLDEFTSGRRVPGRLPIVVAGAGAAFGSETRHATLRELERASERLQVVLVVDDAQVETWVEGLGPDAAIWSPEVAARVEAEERERREAEERERREAEQRAVREAEERARREAEEIARLEEQEQARRVRELPQVAPRPPSAPIANPAMVDLVDVEHEGGVEVHTARNARLAPVPPPAEEIDAREPQVIDATEVIDATDAAITRDAGTDSDDWWIPIVARPGASRATRPVGEDLAQRRRRAEQLQADATSTTVHCDVHRNIETTLHCNRCALPFCDQCLALLGEPPALHCVDCALEMSGVRSGRLTGRE